MLPSTKLAIIRHTSDAFLCSFEDRPADFEGPQGAHHEQQLEVSVCLQGHAEVQLDRQKVVLAPTQLVLIPPGVEHSSSTISSVSECDLLFHEDFVEQTLDSAYGNAGRKAQWSWRHGPNAVSPALDQLLSVIHRAIDGPRDAAGKLLIDSLAVSLLLMIARDHALRRDPLYDLIPAKLRRVEELMRTAPGSNFSLTDLAAMAGLSQYHFLRSFKKAFGESPYAHLIRRRVEAAEVRVRGSEQPLTHIAHDLGFGSSSRFSRVFKQVYGEPPSQWRRRHRAVSVPTS